MFFKWLCEWDIMIEFFILVIIWVLWDGEQDGVDYYFLMEEVFKKIVVEDGMFEYVYVFGNFYGLLKVLVQVVIDQGLDVFFDVDW